MSKKHGDSPCYHKDCKKTEKTKEIEETKQLQKTHSEKTHKDRDTSLSDLEKRQKTPESLKKHREPQRPLLLGLRYFFQKIWPNQKFFASKKCSLHPSRPKTKILPPAQHEPKPDPKPIQHDWKKIYTPKIKKIKIVFIRLSRNILQISERISAHFLRRLSRLLRPTKRLQNHRYRSFRRLLLLRQSFYLVLSLSCFSVILGTFWFFISAQHWQDRLQKDLKQLFTVLEQEHGIQIRFKLEKLYLLHKIELRDIQVRLQVPLQNIEQQSDALIPRIPPLQKQQPQEPPQKQSNPSQVQKSQEHRHLIDNSLSNTLQHILSSLDTSPSQQTAQLQKELLQHLSNPNTKASTNAKTVAYQLTAQQNRPNTKKQLTLYVAADHLQIKYSLLAMLQNTWKLFRAKNPSSPDKQFAWKLFELLQNIKQLQFGNVEFQLVSLPASTLQNPHSTDKKSEDKKPEQEQKSTNETRPKKNPFIWQDFLQTLRSFPIAIKSFQFHLNLQQRLFDGEDIRFVLQPSHKNISGIAQKKTLINKTWQALLSLFNPKKPSLLDEYNATHTDLESSYFFDLQGRFRSDFGQKPQEPESTNSVTSTKNNSPAHNSLTLWGQLHASGALTKNLDHGYLILELMELYSNYTSLTPTLFKIQYLPQSLKLEALSDIRALDLKLNYLFQERLLDLKFATKQFRLGDYLTLQEHSYSNNNPSLSSSENANKNTSRQDSTLQKFKPLLDAQLSGEGQLQISLNDLVEPEVSNNSTPTDNATPQNTDAALNYSGDIQVYLPQQDLLLDLNGRGNLQRFDAKAIKISQDTWQANFQGDISYDTLLPQGNLGFHWRSLQNSEASQKSGKQNDENNKEDVIDYRAQFTLQRSSSQHFASSKNKTEDILLIDTIFSQFSGAGLLQKGEAQNYAEPGSIERTLLSGLPPWAQPQLQLVVLHEQGNYHISSQIHVPLDQQQLQYAELALQQLTQNQEGSEIRQSLYKQKKLYLIDTPSNLSSPAEPPQAERPQAEPPQTEFSQAEPPQAEPPQTEFSQAEPPQAEPSEIASPISKVSPQIFQTEPASKVAIDPFEPLLYPQDHSAFYLLPVLGLSGSIHLADRASKYLDSPKSDLASDLASNLKLNLNTLQWQRDGIVEGAVPIPVLLGAQAPQNLDFVFPGLDESFWQMHSSLLSDLKDFHLWLQDFQIKTTTPGRKFSLQGTVTPQQIEFNEFQLHWDAMDIVNRFRWSFQDKQGYGILTIQEQSSNYQLKRLALPIINSNQGLDFNSLPKFSSTNNRTSSHGWLLQGDHELYVYTDGQNYQISFQDFPLPKIPGLSSTRLQDTIAASENLSNSTLSLQARIQPGLQPHLQTQNKKDEEGEIKSPQIEIPLFQLKFSEGNTYFPEGAEMHLIGTWQAKELLFEHLALYEPHRQLFGWGSLRFTKPLAPIYPAPQIAFPLKNDPNNQAQSETQSKEEEVFVASPSEPQNPPVKDYNDWLEASTLDYKPPKPPPIEEKKAYWVGEFSFQGSLTEAGIRQGVPLIKGGENLELNLFTEGQNFFTSAEGRLDATRLNQVFALLQKRNTQNLRRGTLKFKLKGEGDFVAPVENYGLEGQQKGKTQVSLKQLQGNWLLEDAEYAGHQLELGSQLMWRGANNNLSSNSWILSNIRGNFGAIELERSFLSFRDASNNQQIAGLLNYSVRLQNDYLSSIAIKLTRSKQNNIWDVFSPVEQELLRWRGNLYSYPLRSYTTSSGEQSGASLAALGNNLRDNIFKETSIRSKPIYPGFDIFVEPNITQDGITELRLFRHNRKDLDIGLRAESFWLQVGQAFPISFRAQGSNDGEIIDAQVQNLLIRPELLNIFIPEDQILKKPVMQFSQGRIFGSLRVYGSIFDPSLDGSLNLQGMVLESPYFPGQSPTANVELISEGHIIMAKPFYIQFQDGRLYTPGYEEVYLRHKSLRIMRYYLGFRAEGKEGVPLFYDVYGIQYQTNAKGTVRLEGSGQSGYLNADLELNHLLMQGSQRYNAVQSRGSSLRKNPYTFSLDIQTRIGRSARLVYPRETSPIFSTRLNPRDELLISYDGASRKGSIDGRVALYDGELYLLGNQMDLRKGELIFDESFEYFSPEISLFFSLYSYDFQGQGVQINMDYQGELADLADQNWSPNISSQPPLPEQRLRYLVAAQISAGGEDQANSIATTQNIFLSEVLASLGSNVVIKPVEELIRKGFKVFDEVSLKTGLLGNLLDDYLGISYDTPTEDNWLKYLDNSHMSFGTYVDRDNTILLSFNIDLLYDTQDTSSILLSRDGLQFIPGLGLKFSTPLLDISLDIGFAHIDDFFITDSSLLLEWSLSDFINRRRLVVHNEEHENDELVMYAEE